MDAMVKASLKAAHEAIETGTWDAHLADLKAAIESRQRHLTFVALSTFMVNSLESGAVEGEDGLA